MLVGALSFLAGNCLVQLLPVLPQSSPWGFTLCLLLVASVILRWPVAVWGLLGIAWAWSHAALLLSHDLPAELEGRDLEIRGFVASLPEATPGGLRFLVDVLFTDRTAAVHFPQRLELTWYDAAAEPAAGEIWKFTVRLRRRRGFANPGGYDYEAQLLREGIGATGYVRGAGENRRLSGPASRYLVLRLRGFIAGQLAAALPDSPMLGIVQGLAVGEQQQMTPGQWRIFAATGTSHLMAISGLHIAMVAALSAALGGVAVRLPRMQQRRFSASDGRAIGCIVGAIAYTALAGFGVPAQRTLVMLCIYCGARLLRRELKATQGLALSLFAVLLLDPLAPLSIGAWLSFGAVGAILWLLAGRIRMRRQDSKRSLIEFLRVQWAVTIGLFPLLVFAFGSVSLVSPLVNLVAIPFFTLLIVPAVLAGAAAMIVWPPLGQLVLSGTARLLETAWPFLGWAASFDHSVWHLPDVPLWTSILLVIGACVVIAPGFAATRLAGIMLCLPALLWRPEAVGTGEFRLTLLDVGQGLSVVVQTRTHTLLYDAGPSFRSGRDTGEMVVLPFMHSRGIRRIDTAIASHGDLDHVGGLASVLAETRVERVFASPSVHLKNPPPIPCLRGTRWQWDDVEFAILHPAAGDGLQSDNNASCVLRIQGRGGGALLLGDIERAGEQELIDADLVQPTEIVVAAHHGSRTSSTAGLVERVQARYVLFGTGYRNRWGFPRPDVVARWQESGATTHSTASSGAIEILVGASSIQPPLAYRQQHRRYWKGQ